MKNSRQFIISVLLIFCAFTVYADNLLTATGIGTSTTTDAGTYVNVATASLNVSNVQSVMVVATFELKVDGTNTNSRTASFRLANTTNSDYGAVIDRRLEKDKGGDKGIGSTVYIFDVSTYTGDMVFALQHTTSNSSYDNVTTGTITVCALTTTGGIHLSNDMKTIDATGVAVGNNEWESITGLESDAVFLPVSGSIFVTASINSYKASGTGDQLGEWKIQYRRGLYGDWEDYGNSISRNISSNDDEGIASLGFIVTGLSRDSYYFRMQHKGPASSTIKTINTTLLAVALAYHDETGDMGYAFPAFNTSSDSENEPTTTSASFSAALSQAGTPAGNTDLFIFSQYNMSATDALDAPSFEIQVSGDASYSYTSEPQQRRLSSSSDVGAGASAGLAKDLISGDSYTASLMHASNGSVTLTTSNIILCGFQTTAQLAEGYWTGGTSFVWDNTENWADGAIPSASTNVTIFDKSNEPTISAAAVSCNNLNVVAGGSLSLESGKTLNIAGDLIIESGGSFISAGTVNVTGSITSQRTVAKDIWHYIASPVAGQGISDFIANNDVAQPDAGGYPTTYSFYRWDEPTNQWVIHNSSSPAFGDINFDAGQGYIATFANDVTLEFKGTLNAPSITQTVYKTATSGKQGFNLLGNPFLSPISLSVFTNSTNNPNIEGTIYFWSEGGSWTYPSDNYAYWNSSGSIGQGTQIPSDQIGVAQGFMVKATANAVDVNFNAAMQTHANPVYFKEENKDFMRISIQFEDAYYNETLISLLGEANLGFDRDFDARKLKSDAALYLYTLSPDKEYELAIQGLPLSSDEDIEIPLVIECANAGTYILKNSEFSNTQGSYKIFLEDRLQEKLLEYSDFEELSIDLNAGITDDRFFIQLKNTTRINDGKTEEIPLIYSYSDQLIIDNSASALSYKLTDLRGSRIMEGTLEAGKNCIGLPDLPSAYYIVGIIDAEKVYYKKIWIQ